GVLADEGRGRGTPGLGNGGVGGEDGTPVGEGDEVHRLGLVQEEGRGAAHFADLFEGDEAFSEDGRFAGEAVPLDAFSGEAQPGAVAKDEAVGGSEVVGGELPVMLLGEGVDGGGSFLPVLF